MAYRIEIEEELNLQRVALFENLKTNLNNKKNKSEYETALLALMNEEWLFMEKVTSVLRLLKPHSNDQQESRTVFKELTNAIFYFHEFNLAVNNVYQDVKDEDKKKEITSFLKQMREFIQAIAVDNPDLSKLSDDAKKLSEEMKYVFPWNESEVTNFNNFKNDRLRAQSTGRLILGIGMAIGACSLLTGLTLIIVASAPVSLPIIVAFASLLAFSLAITPASMLAGLSYIDKRYDKIALQEAPLRHIHSARHATTKVLGLFSKNGQENEDERNVIVKSKEQRASFK